MLNRGATAGLTRQRFVSGFQHRWGLICLVNKLRRAYVQAYRDILSYRASAPKAFNRLVKLRMTLLGRQTGYAEEMQELEDNKVKLDVKLDDMLKQHYNLTREQAGKILDSAMTSEAINHGLKQAGR